MKFKLPSHELSNLINTFIHSLELLLLGMKPATTSQIPQNIDDAHIQLVAHSHGLIQLLVQVCLQVIDLIHHEVLEALCGGTGHFVNVLLEKLTLALPVSTLCSGDACAPLLEEGSREVT